jgi:peroxiredoxin
MASKQEGQQPPGTGQPAPDFSLLNTDGQSLILSDGLERRPLVVVFYRGDW